MLGEPASGTVTVTSGGSTRVLPGQGDPQLMRMLLLQILTGRRASEICLCPFDCLSPATDSAIEAAEGNAVARFRYGQSKIDAAPDTILVDAETVAVIEEQQQWLRDRFPGRDLPYLFPQRRANAHAAKPYGNTNYGRSLALFSELAQITDAAGHPVKLSHTHRFRGVPPDLPDCGSFRILGRRDGIYCQGSIRRIRRSSVRKRPGWSWTRVGLSRMWPGRLMSVRRRWVIGSGRTGRSMRNTSRRWSYRGGPGCGSSSGSTAS